MNDVIMSIILLFFIFSQSLLIRSIPTLISVVQIFRHGQRTPIKFYPNDPYSDPAYWPVAPKQLTETGKAQLQTLGEYTRKRYANVLPAAHSEEVIYAQTASVDRARISAQRYILGLFPPTNTEQRTPDTAWSSIPVHHSNVLPKFMSCPAFDKEFMKVLTNEPFYQNISATYKKTFAYLTQYTGSNVTFLTDIFTIYDAFLLETEFGFALPRWSEAVFPEPITTMAGYFFQGFGFDKKLVRLGVGSFFNEVFEHFETLKKNSSSAQFFRVYSAHDTNIVGVLSALGPFKPHVPSFGSSIYIELWNYIGTYYVNIYYKNKDTMKKIIPLGCSGFDCEMGALKTQLSDIILNITSWTTECVT